MVEGVKGISSDLGDGNVSPLPVREFRPEPFVLTKTEWAADNREPIFRRKRILATNTILFQVPKGKTLYITNAFMTGQNPTATVDFCRIYIGGITGAAASDSTDENTILMLELGLSSNVGETRGGTSIVISYPMPIKVSLESAVVADRDQAATTQAGFIGYLE